MEFLVAALFVSQVIVFIFIYILFKRQEVYQFQLTEFQQWRKNFREVLVIILKEHKKSLEMTKDSFTEFKADTVDIISQIGNKVFTKTKGTEKKPVKKAKK